MLLTLSACDEHLAVSADDQPVLSIDTLRMGQLLAGNSSRTYQVRILNPCDRELRLSSVSLRHGSTSGFRMNVDGMNGVVFDDADLLRIASNDSMFVFVEATFAETGGGLTSHTDYIDVLCNGRLQSVVLEAESKDVLKYRGEVLTSDQHWARTLEMQVYDSLVIAEGVTLTVADSVTVYLHDKADIIVRGTLQCAGLPGAPVTIRGDRTDNMFPNLPYDNLPSQWGSLYLCKGSGGSRFVHTDIHGMSDGIFIDSTDVVFEACRLKNSGGNLLTCQMSTVSMLNCELSNAAGSLYAAYGGWHDLTHCTLANYHFASRISQEALLLSNVCQAELAAGPLEAGYTPLYRCVLTNTLVWGDTFMPDVALKYYRVAIGEDALGAPILADSVFCYRFDHCLLRAKGTDDADFVQTVWNEDPLYQLIDDKNYTYDFHLLEDSPAKWRGVDCGVKSDLEGAPRPDVPSIGCYEYIKADNK